MSEQAPISSKKDLRIARQNRRKHPEITKQIILLWEELRQKLVLKERKHELCTKIINISKTVIIELIRLKVTARVFESVIEFGTVEHRWTIFEIIKSDILSLCQGKYSHFAIISMLKHGTKDQKLSVYKVMAGNVVSLLQDMNANKVVEVAYNDFANAQQRSDMIQEFYDKTFVLFNTNNNEIKRLSDFTKNSKFDLSIFSAVQKVLIPIIRKNKVHQTIVQQVIYEYLTALEEAKKQNPSESAVKSYQDLIDELVDLVHEQIIPLCNNRFGVKQAMKIYFACPAKMRKKVVQSMKEVIVELCTNRDAFMLVLAVLDQTDDTVLLRKNIVLPILGDQLDEVFASVHGKKIIQFLLSGRDKRFITPFIMNLLGQADSNEHTKKDSATRVAEIVEICTAPLLKWTVTKIDDMLRYTDSIVVLLNILEKCLPAKDDKLMSSYVTILEEFIAHIDEPITNSVTTLKREAATEKKPAVPKKKIKHNFTGFSDDTEQEKPEPVEETQSQPIETHLLESNTSGFIVKMLFRFEKEQKIDSFSKMCIDKISVDNLKSFVNCNRSAFFLVGLFETGNTEVQDFLKKHLAGLKSTMQKSELPGVKILCKHLF